MTSSHSNIVLIGMPGAGKSTVGVLLAKTLSCQFVDTDVLIQAAENRSLQDIMDHDGYLELRAIEERVIMGFSGEHFVVATGGSAVYSSLAMLHLKTSGRVVYLDVTMDTLRRRVKDYDQRGIARRPDQSFEDLFLERATLYRMYADITIQCDDMDHEAVVSAIHSQL
jgi:shikimate kinase